METSIVRTSLQIKKKILAGLTIAATAAFVPGAGAATAARGDLLIYRIGPTTSELYVANADGSDEHRLIQSDGFD